MANTLSKIVKDDAKDRLQIEIGDSKQTAFYPQVKLMRWDNEVNFSARLIEDEKQTETVSKDASDKVKWEKGDLKADFYELPISKDLPEGGYEMEITLAKKTKKQCDIFYHTDKRVRVFLSARVNAGRNKKWRSPTGKCDWIIRGLL